MTDKLLSSLFITRDQCSILIPKDVTTESPPNQVIPGTMLPRTLDGSPKANWFCARTTCRSGCSGPVQCGSGSATVSWPGTETASWGKQWQSPWVKNSGLSCFKHSELVFSTLGSGYLIMQYYAVFTACLHDPRLPKRKKEKQELSYSWCESFDCHEPKLAQRCPSGFTSQSSGFHH